MMRILSSRLHARFRLRPAGRAAVAVLLAAASASCDVGLGGALDLEAPRVSVTSHDDNASVARQFTLAGTASDNESVTKITIDFDDAGLHFRWSNGSGWEKKTASAGWNAVAGTEKASCIWDNGCWNWAVSVDLDERRADKSDSTYGFSVIAYDEMGNSGKNSKVERTLTLDENDPDVVVNLPSLFSRTYDSARELSDAYALKDGSCISRLLNGTFTVSGRQSGAAIFEELLLEFDDGALAVGTEGTVRKTGFQEFPPGTRCGDIAEQVKFDNDTKTKTYLAKSLRLNQPDEAGNIVDDLRNWEFSITRDELASKNAELKSGRRLIRVVTTSVSSSGTWERKVQGWFVWWPEADVPWVEAFNLDTEDRGDGMRGIYPSSRITGYAQDDDGIKTLSYTMYKKDGGAWTEVESDKDGSFAASDEFPAYRAWSLRAPSDEGVYKLSVSVTDIYGTDSEAALYYFRTMDVKAPKIIVDAPEDGASALGDADGSISFRGSASDDGSVQSLLLVHLNPEKNRDPNNKITYLVGGSDVWKPGTDGAGNTVYELALVPQHSDGRADDGKCYSFERKFTIFSDFNIDGTDRKLGSQQFIFRAVDNSGQSSMQSLVLAGDMEAPEITIDSITIRRAAGESQTYLFGEEALTLPQFAYGDTAEVRGTWSDNSTRHWSDKAKIGGISIEWKDARGVSSVRNDDGTWIASIGTLPQATTALITASVADYGGNTAKKNASFYIESGKAEWKRIGADTDDGSYSAGAEIIITMEFNKPVSFSGGAQPPSLALNNGGTAGYADGNGASKHRFTYVVQPGHDVPKLKVAAVRENGNSWKDAATGGLVGIDIGKFRPDASGGPGGALDDRNIRIDTVAPEITRVVAKTADGSYKAGAAVITLLEFSEPVSISNAGALQLQFSGTSAADGRIVSTEAFESGPNAVLFSYTVKAGDNAAPLSIESFDCGGATIADAAGNKLSKTGLPSCAADALNGICIDTEAPAAPEVALLPDSPAVYDADGVEIIVAGESGAAIEYTVDNGKSWQAYSGAVRLQSNGMYAVMARQTDKAGNCSQESVPKSVRLDIGDILSRISARTLNGTYTAGAEIIGEITFRKPVSLESGAAVVVNVADAAGGRNETAVSIESPEAPSLSKLFRYKVQDGDGIFSGGAIDSAACLDVVRFGFDSVWADGVAVPAAVPPLDAGSGKRLADNREIRIITGRPEVTGVFLAGEDSAARLEITFSRTVSKGSGCITFTQDLADYKVPAVLSESEYNELSADAAIRGSYREGINGAALSGDGDGRTVSPDLTRKYVLDFGTDAGDEELAAAFKAARKHIVEIPIYSSNASVSGSVLTVSLAGGCALPVKGAKYAIDIPEGLVNDELSNRNSAASEARTAPGVEIPVIRVNKRKEAVVNGAAVQPFAADVKIDCQTPGAAVRYRMSEVDIGQTVYQGADRGSAGWQVVQSHKEPSMPSGPYKECGSGGFRIGREAGGSDVGSVISSMKGYKVVIESRAQTADRDNPNKVSQPAYEYAARTALIFETTIGVGAGGAVIGGVALNKMSMWVRGGDSSSGGNSTPGFPLSWSAADYSGCRLMTGKFTDASNLRGRWYWISWDVSAPAYHGFLLGDVPGDAAGKGPKAWCWGSASYVEYKDRYKLYPGEALYMKTKDDNCVDGIVRGNYVFNLDEYGGHR